LDIRQIIEEAARQVEAADVPDDLRAVAFQKVVDLLASRSPGEAGSGGVSGAQRPSQDTSMVDRIAAKINVDPGLVADCYYEEGGDLKLALASSRLGASRKAATRQLAVLCAAGRQAAGIEDWTGASLIREVCDYYGKFDSNNFAFTISQMDSMFQIRGKGQDREVRVKQPGYEEAAKLIAQFGSAASGN
jgi:hypothetical protein